MNEEIFEKSIVLIGPAGAGKSLISRELSKKTGMPLISLDLMRDCPKTLEEIEQKIIFLENKITELKEERKTKGASEELDNKIEGLKNDSGVCCDQIKMRKLLPNLPNYKQLGMDRNVSRFLFDNYGDIGWHFYVKQFENELLAMAIKQLKIPIILDTGGGMAISLEQEYKKLRKLFLKLDAKKYYENFDEKKIGFKHIKKALEPFSNVVELKLPNDFKTSMSRERAGKDKLNEAFITSGQYEKLATNTVEVAGLVQNGVVNKEKLNKIANQILSSSDVIKKIKFAKV